MLLIIFVEPVIHFIQDFWINKVQNLIILYYSTVMTL